MSYSLHQRAGYLSDQRASEASELSPYSCQLRFQIYALDVRQVAYAHAQEIIARKRLTFDKVIQKSVTLSCLLL